MNSLSRSIDQAFRASNLSPLHNKATSSVVISLAHHLPLLVHFLGAPSSQPHPMAPPLEDHHMEEEAEEQRPPLIRALLHRSATTNTSQVAMVGSNQCPIESLDYE